MRHVKILLSTYNGEQYLNELLTSLNAQKNVYVSVLVRDDGSFDNTRSILEAFSERANMDIQLIKGKNIGYLRSFWELIMLASDADYYALCDQDDYWCPQKLSSAVKLIEKESDEASVLYTSNVITVDEKMRRIKMDSFSTHEVISFADSLKRSVLPGCTFVFNNSLLNYLKQYKGAMIVHDWIIYLIAKAVGKVIYDDKPHIMYRLHGNNACGVETGITGLRKKIKRFRTNKTLCVRSQVARDILIFKENMKPEDVLLAENFANYKNSIRSIFYLLKYKEYRNVRFLFMLMLKKV